MILTGIRGNFICLGNKLEIMILLAPDGKL